MWSVRFDVSRIIKTVGCFHISRLARSVSLSLRVLIFWIFIFLGTTAFTSRAPSLPGLPLCHLHLVEIEWESSALRCVRMLMAIPDGVRTIENWNAAAIERRRRFNVKTNSNEGEQTKTENEHTNWLCSSFFCLSFSFLFFFSFLSIVFVSRRFHGAVQTIQCRR